MASELVDLATVILKNAKAIDERCKQLGQVFPSLDAPYNSESNAILYDASVSAASAQLVSAAGQLVATAQGPVQSTLDTVYGFLLSSALRTASISGVADVLANNAKGMHVTELATQTGISDSSKLGRHTFVCFVLAHATYSSCTASVGRPAYLSSSHARCFRA